MSRRVHCFHMEMIKIFIEVITLILAIIAVYQTWKEFKSHKHTEYHKLFSQLNRRYERNTDMQDVVKYLRNKEPFGEKPSMYQLEVFLRFFEELGLYMKTNSLETNDVDKFFGYYLRQLYTTPNGRLLVEELGEEEKELDLLQIVKEKLKINSNL